METNELDKVVTLDLPTFVENHEILAKLRDKFLAEILADCKTWDDGLSAIILTHLHISTVLMEDPQMQKVCPRFVELLQTISKLNLAVLMNYEKSNVT